MKVSVIRVIRKSDGEEIGINEEDFNPELHVTPEVFQAQTLLKGQPSEFKEVGLNSDSIDALIEKSDPTTPLVESDSKPTLIIHDVGLESEKSDVDFTQTTPDEPEVASEGEPDPVNDVEDLFSFNVIDARVIIAGITDLAILDELEAKEKNGKDRISIVNAIERRREEL